MCRPVLCGHGVGSSGCILLAVMAYDCYAVVCWPLQYTTIMHPQLCVSSASIAWLSGLITSLIQWPQTGPHFLWGASAYQTYLCGYNFQWGRKLCGRCNLSNCPCVTHLSLLWLYNEAVLSIKSARGHQKACGTCSFHLIVVIIFNGTIFFMYVHPAKSSSKNQGKFFSLLRHSPPPALNLIFYTLRNKDVKLAMRTLVMGNTLCSELVWAVGIILLGCFEFTDYLL